MESKNQKYQQAVEKAAQLAYRYESKYYACSQTVLAALMETFGIGDINVLRAATTFAGGVAQRHCLWIYFGRFDHAGLSHRTG